MGLLAKGFSNQTHGPTSFLEEKRINGALSAARYLIRSDEF